jgi:hypothetical protein
MKNLMMSIAPLGMAAACGWGQEVLTLDQAGSYSAGKQSNPSQFEPRCKKGGGQVEGQLDPTTPQH